MSSIATNPNYPFHANIKRMPGARSPEEYLFDFKTDPGQRGEKFTLKGDVEILKNFLVAKLHQVPATASRIAAEVVTTGNSFVERLPFQPGEVTPLIRDLEEAHRRADARGLIIDYKAVEAGA